MKKHYPFFTLLITLFTNSVAMAQDAAKPTMWESLLPMVAIFFVFYFFLIRPQAKKMKDQQKMTEALKRGDSVITQSGILGTIEGVTEKYITLEIAPNVKIKMLKSQIAGAVKESIL